MKKENLKYISSALLLLVAIVLIDQLNKAYRAGAIIKACEAAFGRLDVTQKDSIKQMYLAFLRYGDRDQNKLAYILATARHESNFRPIKERRAAPSQTTVYNLQNAYWHTGYYGRGFVQLTWQRNYQKMSDFLGVDLVSNPDLALNPKYAAKILVYGMLNGSFTRKPLSQYIQDSTADFYNARKVVNGLDKASLIANYSQSLLTHLK